MKLKKEIKDKNRHTYIYEIDDPSEVLDIVKMYIGHEKFSISKMFLYEVVVTVYEDVD